MPSSHKVVHGMFALGSFSAAISSLLISVRLGALEFVQENCESFNVRVRVIHGVKEF
jgi:hypothetical protein